MDEPISIICERAFEFASRILKLCTRLYDRGAVGRHLATELIKSGTSIGANAEEGQEASALTESPLTKAVLFHLREQVLIRYP